MQTLVNSLNDLCNHLDQKYNINSGGCCFVAFALAYNLNKYKIRYKVKFFSRGYCIPSKKMEMRKLVKNNDLDSLSHYAIVIGKSVINGGGFNKDRWYKKLCVGCITPDDLMELYESGSWNDRYNMKHNDLVFNKISKIIDDYFRRG